MVEKGGARVLVEDMPECLSTLGRKEEQQKKELEGDQSQAPSFRERAVIGDPRPPFA